MQERRVVTLFLERGGKIALFRRSNLVATYAGKYGAISGAIEDNVSPLEQAKRELLEETGLLESVTFLGEGEPIRVEAPEYDAIFVVHPFLVHMEFGEIKLNFEHDQVVWATPAELRSMDTVPELSRTFDAVASREGLNRTMDRLKLEIASDRISGSLGLAARGVNVLAIGELSHTWYGEGMDASFFEHAEEVANLRGGMEVIRNAAAHAALEVQRGGDDPVSDRLFRLGHEIVAQRAQVAKQAAAWLQERNVKRIFTLSWSTTVHETLLAIGPDSVEVNIIKSSPGGEGVQHAEKLAREGFKVTLFPDSSLHVAIKNSDVVLLGADAVLTTGSFVNKTGSFLACSLAERMQVPSLVVTETMKFCPSSVWQRETAPWRPSLYQGANLSVWSEPFEEVPGELVHRFVTEKGVLVSEEAQALCLGVQDELKRYGLMNSFFSVPR